MDDEGREDVVTGSKDDAGEGRREEDEERDGG